MASVLQSPQWSSRSGPEGEDLTTIERWFLSQGVPQFVYGYWPSRDSMPVLFYLLLIVVAFDLAIQPWAPFNPWFLLAAPAVLVFVGLFLGVLFKAMIIDQARYFIHELAKEWQINGKSSYRSFKEQFAFLIHNPVRSAKLFAGIYLVSCLILLLGRDLYWNDFTIAFGVIAVLLWTSARLFRPDLWSQDEKLPERRRLYIVVAVAVTGFALEGSILPDATAMMDGVLGSIAPAAVPVPQAFAALLVTVAILLQSQALIPAPSEAAGVQSQGPIPAPSGTGEVAAPQRFNVFFPAIPLLVLVLCFETAILPYVGPVWVAAAVPLAAMVGLASLHLLLRRRPKWLTTPRLLKKIASYQSVRGFITYPGVTSLVVLYLVACPLLVGTLAASGKNQSSIGSFTNPANAKSVLLLTFAVNLFFLSLVVGIAVFRLQDVARWAIKEVWTDLRGRITNLGRGLSILLGLAGLALFTAEIWEAMGRMNTRDYLLFVGLIMGLAGAFHLITSVQDVPKIAAFGTWLEVRAAAMLEEELSQNDDYRPDSKIKDLLDSKELHFATLTNVAPKRPLGGLETINSVIVMMTYEIFFFLPVTIVAAIAFLAFGRIMVSDKVGANWIYGDRATTEELDELINLPLIQQPWVRVGLLLTAFSILYLAVDILSDSGKRSAYFENADKAVRQRLAVRLAYCEVRARRGLPQPGDPGSFRRDRHVHHGGTPGQLSDSHP